MDKEMYRRVKRIFDAAADLSADEQDRFLEDACRDDPEVRAEVERLLRAEPETSAGVEKTKRTEARATPLPQGHRIGPYRILRHLGEGGMGVVFEAEQEHPVRRRVALKLIQKGLDGARVLARFDAERQALALMNHPNVARVLDAGSDADGRPYFVMDYIKGVPITDYCDRHNLPTRERLDLMIQVCDGVQHAHQKGVIHRDLKPGNILVEILDGKPVPKIIDFGVAKAIDSPSPTSSMRSCDTSPKPEDGIRSRGARLLRPEAWVSESRQAHRRRRPERERSLRGGGVRAGASLGAHDGSPRPAVPTDRG